VYQLADLEHQYLDHHRALGHSPQTIAHYTNTFISFHKFLDATGTPATSESLTTATMNAYAGWLRETPTKGFRGSTHRREHGLHGLFKDLKAFCRWLVAEEFLDKGPKIPLPKLPSTLYPVLTDDELLRVFATNQLSPRTEIGCRNRALVAFMLDTGVRLAEVTRLQLADIQIKDGMAKVTGKGSKERMVFFAPDTADELKRWLVLRGESEGTFFWLKPEGVRMLFGRIRREAGLEIFHPHQVRHTCATNLLRRGADTHSVRRMLGHSSLVVTERYLSLMSEDLKAKHAASSPFESLKARMEPVRAGGKRRLKTA
jgi:site-specific recombinase XerD